MSDLDYVRHSQNNNTAKTLNLEKKEKQCLPFTQSSVLNLYLAPSPNFPQSLVIALNEEYALVGVFLWCLLHE